MTLQQLEQLELLTSPERRVDKDMKVVTTQNLGLLAKETEVPFEILDCFGSVFQMIQLQNLCNNLTYHQLMKLFTLVPSNAPLLQQIQHIQQLIQIFAQLSPENLATLQKEVKETKPQLESRFYQLTKLQSAQFHLFPSIHSMLEMDDLPSFLATLSNLKPIQITQLVLFLHLPQSEVIELKMIFQNQQKVESDKGYVLLAFIKNLVFI
jgi:hypothetical protein